jgi:hypothetical protein
VRCDPDMLDDVAQALVSAVSEEFVALQQVLAHVAHLKTALRKPSFLAHVAHLKTALRKPDFVGKRR